MNGKIIVLTGDGKGKTTSAFGMAVRASGHGKKVVIIQFLKKGMYGEIRAEIKNVEIRQFGREEFIFEPEKEDYELTKKAIEFSLNALKKQPFMLILDEINVALSIGLVKVKDVLKLIDKRGETHIVLTGRNAPSEIIECADIVTEMKNIKHYYDKGTKAIEGIEY
ncbi:MAG TPA: cob(I)yrinic acid a,c-diamide adenosyltransferase [Thermoplasmatales archaeon]|nr:cob(I)yrinic acid a,c-diamide adenosyltransferase [Thermoplasmatales archaeon]